MISVSDRPWVQPQLGKGKPGVKQGTQQLQPSMRFGSTAPPEPPSKKPPQQPKRPNPLVWLALLGLGAFGLSVGMRNQEPPPPAVSVAPGEPLPDVEGLILATPQELLEKIKADRVKEIHIEAGQTALQWKILLKNDKVQYFVPNPQQEGFGELVTALREKGIHPQVKNESDMGRIFLMVLLQFAPLLLIGYFVLRLMKTAGGGGVLDSMKGKMKPVEVPKVTLNDVAGIPEVVTEIRSDILDLFKDRSSKVGEKLPSGVLLEGPPGTGKTLMAKAIAGELNRPFFSMSGSDFVEMFVGLGARRVRDLFQQAKKHAPSVIFIDEIDAVGKKRGMSGGFGGHDEREQTLNAILAEMDGFGSSDDVLVLAATNRADVLDDALVRPGRFDKKYTVTPPMTPEGRRDILNVHTRKKKVAEDVDPLFIARRMWPGTSGADIEKIVNEAALLARRRKHAAINRQDFLDAIERIHMGLPKEDVAFTPDDKRRVAAHETLGHAAVAWALSLPVQFITVVPRNMNGGGTALGIMGTDPEGMPKYHQTRQFMEKMACMIMGGRAAEEALYGKDDVSTGASNDWMKVNQLMKNAIETSALYPELFGQVTIQPNDSPFGQEGASQELRARGERVRNELLQGLYDMTVAFVKAIPQESKEKILAQIEDAETINDPEAIREMFNNSGVNNWQQLWKTATDPVREQQKQKTKQSS